MAPIYHRAIVVCVVAMALSATVNAQQSHLDTSIRLVKWDSLLAHDTIDFRFDSEATSDDSAFQSSLDSELSHDTNIRLDSQSKFQESIIPTMFGTISMHSFPRPYYIVKREEHDSIHGFDGFFDSSIYHLYYVDLNRDRHEDAILSLTTFGSEIYGEAIIFLQTIKGPKFVTGYSGSHYWDTLYGDTLAVYTSHWISDVIQTDPNCCYRALDVQRIVGDGDSVRFLPLTVEPVTGYTPNYVDSFYGYLNSKDYKDAYSLLSKSYQAAYPYKMWLKGFASTVSVSAVVDSTSTDSIVHVKIISQDSIDGKIVTRHYAGAWHVKFITNNLPDGDPRAKADWFLDRPEIREVK